MLCSISRNTLNFTKVDSVFHSLGVDKVKYQTSIVADIIDLAPPLEIAGFELCNIYLSLL